MTGPQPHEVRAAVAERLLENDELIDLLAPNAPWNDADGTPAKANSIVPMSEIEKMTPLYVGILSGPLVKRVHTIYRGFIYVRIYDAVERDFFNIDKAAYEISRSLNLSRLTMANTVNTQIDLERMTGESFDDALRQKYRELQFGLVIL